MKELLVHIKENPIAVIPDITYSQVMTSMHEVNSALKLSIVMPITTKRVPVLLWLEGGGWKTLSTKYALGELAYFAKRGYAVVSLQYRVSSEGVFPAQLIDVKAGIRYLRAHADKFLLDTEKIGIIGRSSGGHLAALTGLTNGDPQFEVGEWLEQSSEVQAVADLYGPTELVSYYQWLKAKRMDVFAFNIDTFIGALVEKDKQKAEKASPVYYITKKAPPHLILHGDRDSLVPLEQSQLLFDNLKNADVLTEFYILKGAGHGSAEFEQNELKDIIRKFFEKYLK